LNNNYNSVFMRTRSFLLVLLSFFISGICQSQDLNEKTLLTVDGRNTTAGEFIRMYKKSIQPNASQDIDSYLQQFVVFKLKVADAISKRLDTTRSFKDELTGYRNQLAQNYLIDTKTKEKLLEKTYQRSLTEINAWHILINCQEGAKPEDTLKAWQKAIGIRERILNGEPFEDVARGTSDDRYVKFNGGNLGYFTVFQMITPFEDTAYSLKKGAISEPVRTPYGYHIIKVTDKRPSKGKVKVAHIMKSCPPGTGEQEAKEAEEIINNIYKELLDGTSFSELYNKYSDYKVPGIVAQTFDRFGVGEIISDFAEAALSIPDTGNYTKPIRTSYGWHIIKLLDKKAPPSYEEAKSFLESRLNRTYYISLIRKPLISRLKKEYGFRINQPAFNWFVDNTDTLIIKGLAKYNKTKMPKGYLYSFANQHLTTKEFAADIEKRGKMIVTNDPHYFINRFVDSKISEQIIKYEDSILEKKYPDFRYLMNEFHDGILLFEISSIKIWNRVQDDSVGLMKYYEDHKQNFLTRKGIEAKIYTLKSTKGGKLQSAYRKYSKRTGTDQLMLSKFNQKNDSLLVITEGKWFAGDDPEIDIINWITGSQFLKLKNYPSVIVINKIFEPEPLPLSEIRGEMMSGYQDYLENEWIRQLKEQYTVKIDNMVFDEVKKSLSNE